MANSHQNREHTFLTRESLCKYAELNYGIELWHISNTREMAIVSFTDKATYWGYSAAVVTLLKTCYLISREDERFLLPRKVSHYNASNNLRNGCKFITNNWRQINRFFPTS